MSEAVERAAALLDQAPYVAALTGAGISMDSGIPAFRGAQGLWDTYDPMEYATIRAFRANPEKVWGMLRDLGDLMDGALPNPGHTGMAELERLDCLHVIVTQNVDGLHQAAGSRTVHEFHGNSRRLVCLDCGTKHEPAANDEAAAFPPRCACGAVLKPDVVFFGEMIPDEALAHGYAAAKRSRAMLVVGTSAEVHPAAQLPVIAKRNGAAIIEVNPEPSALTETLTDVFIQAGASEAMPGLVAAVRELREN